MFHCLSGESPHTGLPVVDPLSEEQGLKKGETIVPQSAVKLHSIDVPKNLDPMV